MAVASEKYSSVEGAATKTGLAIRVAGAGTTADATVGELVPLLAHPVPAKIKTAAHAPKRSCRGWRNATETEFAFAIFAAVVIALGGSSIIGSQGFVNRQAVQFLAGVLEAPAACSPRPPSHIHAKRHFAFEPVDFHFEIRPVYECP